MYALNMSDNTSFCDSNCHTKPVLDIRIPPLSLSLSLCLSISLQLVSSSHKLALEHQLEISMRETIEDHFPNYEKPDNFFIVHAPLALPSSSHQTSLPLSTISLSSCEIEASTHSSANSRSTSSGTTNIKLSLCARNLQFQA